MRMRAPVGPCPNQIFGVARFMRFPAHNIAQPSRRTRATDVVMGWP